LSDERLVSRFFRVEAFVDMAVEPRRGGPGLAPVEARRLSREAYRALEGLSSRRDAEVKHALGLVLDALTAMERELEIIQRRNLLQSRGVELRPLRAFIGGDGMVADEALPIIGEATVHLSLPVRGHTELLSVDAHIEPDTRTVRFRDVADSVRDVLVAFTFEQQRKERRRELDAVPGD